MIRLKKIAKFLFIWPLTLSLALSSIPAYTSYAEPSAEEQQDKNEENNPAADEGEQDKNEENKSDTVKEQQDENNESKPASAEVSADDKGDDWLHAEKGKICDGNGKEVRLTGANWFGFNCTENVFHGIWSVNMKDLIKGIADHGINIVRIPISTELLYNWSQGNEVKDINVNWHANPELVKSDGSNMTSLEVFDTAMAMFKENGIKVMLDVHSPDSNNTGHNYELWYGKKTADGKEITTDIWIDSWKWIIERYKNDDTLIAADLKNEPHGKFGDTENIAKWDDTKDENNWKYAAEKCADEILSVNPNMLIVVEGVEQTPKEGTEYKDKNNDSYNGAWWGGNLRGVKDNPVNLGDHQAQLVYSPHDYGPLVFDQEWFKKDFTEKTLLDDYWYDSWAYIKEEGIAPLFIGEWGGKLDGDRNEKWLGLLADYMNEKNISHTFWCLNPNSGDTGGLWKDDFQSWDDEKYAILEKTLWKDESGKYVGLDHQRALGSNGISLSEHTGDAPPETISVPEQTINTSDNSSSEQASGNAEEKNSSDKEKGKINWIMIAGIIAAAIIVIQGIVIIILKRKSKNRPYKPRPWNRPKG